LTKEEKDKIKKDKKKNKRKRRNKHEWRIKISLNNLKKDKKESQSKFKYIDEVPKENLQGNCIFIDPGKSLLTMMDDSGKFFSYTNRQYLKETKRLKYHALLKTTKTNRNYQGRGRT
jgi:hypothetical protein